MLTPHEDVLWQRLFELYIGRLTHDGRADSALLARMTAGMSPAEIANTVNKAAASAAEAGAAQVSAEHLLRAIETHQLGGEVSTIKSLQLAHAAALPVFVIDDTDSDLPKLSEDHFTD